MIKHRPLLQAGLPVWPPLPRHCDVQGPRTERSLSLRGKGRVIDSSVMKSATLGVVGTGQMNQANGFRLLTGGCIINGGQHDIRQGL